MDGDISSVPAQASAVNEHPTHCREARIFWTGYNISSSSLSLSLLFLQGNYLAGRPGSVLFSFVRRVLFTRHNALFPCKHTTFHSSSCAYLQITKLLQSSSSLWKIQELICFSLVNVKKSHTKKSHCSAIKTRQRLALLFTEVMSSALLTIFRHSDPSIADHWKKKKNINNVRRKQMTLIVKKCTFQLHLVITKLERHDR